VKNQVCGKPRVVSRNCYIRVLLVILIIILPMASSKSHKPTKYVRHRDLKMKGSELNHERKIQKEMCEGICDHCREKLQWKFTYDKYKPLRHPG
jgi:hypothetical protein